MDIFSTNSNSSCFIWKLVETHHRHSLYFSWPPPMDSSQLAWATPWKGRVPRRCESLKFFPGCIIFSAYTRLWRFTTIWRACSNCYDLNFQVISAASDDHLNSNSTQSPAQVKLYFPFFAETQEEEVLLDNHLKPIIYTVFYFSQCPRVKSHFAQTTHWREGAVMRCPRKKLRK